MTTPTISLTELRQRLFQLADHVADTGEPLVVVRNGIRLKLVRDDAPASAPGRLSRLVAQSVVLGEPLDPHESPSLWNTDSNVLRVAEPTSAEYLAKKPKRRRT